MSDKLVQQAREKALYQYSTALERGDFDTVSQVLRAAEQDPALERMILEVNEEYGTEYQLASQAEAVATVRQLVYEHMSSGAQVDDMELPPLTVGDVAARLQADAAVRGRIGREASTIVEQLKSSRTRLPDNLSLQGVRQVFQQLGLSVTRQFEKIFRETAIFLSMGRNEGMARMAATRRQQQIRRQHSDHKQE